MIPPVLVINLERRLDRATRVTDRLKAANLDYRIMPAYDGLALGAPAGWRPGAWGCLQSHLNLWRWASAHEETIFVMEDDAVFAIDLGQQIEAVTEDWDCLRLGDTTVAYIVKPHVCQLWMQQVGEHLPDLVGLQVDTILSVLHPLSETVNMTPWLVTQEAGPSDTRPT